MRTYIKDEFEHDKNDAIKIKMINLYQSNDHTASLASCVRIENDHTTLLVLHFCNNHHFMNIITDFRPF